jgi:hypothetical protein
VTRLPATVFEANSAPSSASDRSGEPCGSIANRSATRRSPGSRGVERPRHDQCPARELGMALPAQPAGAEVETHEHRVAVRLGQAVGDADLGEQCALAGQIVGQARVMLEAQRRRQQFVGPGVNLVVEGVTQRVVALHGAPPSNPALRKTHACG